MTFLESVQRFEEALLEKVSASQGSPFIAHCDVPSEIEEAGQKELVEWIRGDFHCFITIMARFPCVCVRVVTTALSQSYGKEGDYAAVYKHIAKRLDLNSEGIPPRDRYSFFIKFRNSCEKIGLAFPPVTGERYVDAYLFQAGVSRKQLPALAGAFLKGERLLGLPHDDDTREVDDWEDRAVEFAPPGLTVLRRIVRGDPTGYHAGTFIRLRHQKSPNSEFEREYQRAIKISPESASKGKGTDLSPPTLEFSDGELWVTIPRHASRLEVKIHGKIYPLSRDGRLALSMPWPPTTEWRRPGTAVNDWRSFPVFSESRSILVFDGETGIYRGYLNSAKNSGQSVRAGQLWFLSPTAFQINEETCHPLGPEGFVLFCDISSKVNLLQQDFQCEVGVEARLRMDVVGKRIVRNRDGWLLAGPISLRILGRRGDVSEGLEARISHPALDNEIRIPVLSASDGLLAADPEMPKIGNFGMARVSLHIRGQDRALYRTKFWYWPSLDRLDDGVFFATSIPNNLAKEQLRHIYWDHRNRLALFEDGAYLQARLCFLVGQKLVSFSLKPPGVSLSIRKSDGAERPMKAGGLITVRDDFASSLIVRYSGPKAAIDLKGEIIPNAFGKIGKWSVSFSALNQEGKHNEVRLHSNGNQSLGRVLVRVVPEAEPTVFHALPLSATSWGFEAVFQRPIEEVRIEAENLVFGDKQKETLSLPSPPDHQNDFPLASALKTDELTQIHIEIDQDNYPNGVWFVSFHIREKDRLEYLPLINSRGETYATCITSESYAQKLCYEEISEWCPEPQRAEAFLRLSRIIETPIAHQCRSNGFSEALSAWRRLGNSLDLCKQANRSTLLKACALPPSSHSRESWIPFHHPIEVCPDLFTVKAEDIGQLGSSAVSGYEEFESIGLAGLTNSLKDAVDAVDVSMTFLIAFQNFRFFQSNPDTSPGAFDFSLYCQNAPNMKDMAEDDKPLSIWHHDRACERMADRVAFASEGTRLSKVMTLVEHFKRHETTALKLPHDLEEGFALVQGAPRVIAALSKAWRKGNVERFWQDLATRANIPKEMVQKHMGTLLRLAPELLAFYLLLWTLVEKHETK